MSHLVGTVRFTDFPSRKTLGGTMTYRTTPFAERMPVRRPITPDLLAAAARQPVRLAERVLDTWCGAVESATELDHVLIFDECVIGRPRPLLLEAAWHVRTVRRLDARGVFDEDDADDDPPSVPTRVLQLMADGQEAHHLRNGQVEVVRAARPLPSNRADWFPLIDLTLTLERLVTELSGSIRIGAAAVVDVRLPGEQRSLRWAA